MTSTLGTGNSITAGAGAAIDTAGAGTMYSNNGTSAVYMAGACAT